MKQLIYEYVIPAVVIGLLFLFVLLFGGLGQAIDTEHNMQENIRKEYINSCIVDYDGFYSCMASGNAWFTKCKEENTRCYEE